MTALAEDHPDAWRLPTEPVERAVRDALAGLLRDRGLLASHLPTPGSAAKLDHRLAKLEVLAQTVSEAGAPGLRDLPSPLAARFEVGEDAFTVSISVGGLARELDLGTDPGAPHRRLSTTRPLVLRKRGVETKLVLGDTMRANPDPALIRLVADAHAWMQKLRDGGATRNG